MENNAIAAASEEAQNETSTQPASNPYIKKFTLLYPIDLADGRTLTEINCRRGTVRDMRKATANSKSSEGYELSLIASLTVEQLTPEDLDEMDMDDFAMIQDWFRPKSSK